MTQEDVFNGAMAALVFQTAYANTVAEEIGEEKAVSLITKMCKNMGSIRGQMLKDKAGDIELNAIAAQEIIGDINKSLGIIPEAVEGAPQIAITRIGRCPVYEAAKLLGMDDKRIENRCRKGPMVLGNATLKKLNPNLRMELRKFRSPSDDFCEEAIIQT